MDTKIDSNILISYGTETDKILSQQGHTFLGAGVDKDGGEIHLFLEKGKDTIEDITNNELVKMQEKFLLADNAMMEVSFVLGYGTMADIRKVFSDYEDKLIEICDAELVYTPL